MRICAVIPAAGRGTRLGSNLPKILSPLADGQTIWSVLHAKLAPLVDHVHVVLSPDGAQAFPPLPANVSTSIQPAPIGMGDAIFGSHAAWSQYDAILIVWGDQVFVSIDTLNRAIAALRTPQNHAVLPLAAMDTPYVEYVFTAGKLAAVRQSREGEICKPGGLGDVGTFLLATEGLKPAWDNYLSSAPRGSQTGEVNFLPFLPFLSARGWTVQPLMVPDAVEARGINTKDDLLFFQNLYKGDGETP